MMKKSITIFAFATLMLCLGPVFVSELNADCQIGAFIADWSKNATYPWHGEQGILNYEEIIQRKVACIKIYQKIVDEFPFVEALGVHNHGTESSPTVPYIDIHPSTNGDDSVPRLLEIINGDFDSYIQNWAFEAKAYGKPLWVCFDGEMNGDWHNGSGAANGGATLDGYGDPTKPDGPEIYIDAWRHIHDIFEAVGADNVAWVWSVNNSDWPREPWNKFQNYYPGDDYVDWLGVDGYNWNRVEYAGWQSFQQVFDNQEDEYSNSFNRLRAISTEKPIIIAEFACAHELKANGKRKREWITETFNLLETTYPYVKCFIWFDMDKEENWLIDSAGNEAPRAALSDSYFVSEGNSGTPTLNLDNLMSLALNKNATASSVETGTDLVASKAFDGNLGTRWSSAGSDPQWISVDLGSFSDITKVILSWEAAYAKSYKIQISDDGTYWADVYSTTTGNGGSDNISLSVNTRYVRMYGTERGNIAWGYSLFEFAVYGTGGVIEEQKIHIYSINMFTTAAKGGLSFATAETKIVDSNGQPVSEALVSGHWTGLTTDNDSAVTNSTGLVRCDSDKTKKSGTFIFTVDNVSKSGWTYDSASNVEVSDSISKP
ncbi:MAG: discoidin domain-containing protein [Candidatus Omnitrophica bacterium]|nr:discoidin domain-containing protein [Candidatus Omnitrophota bacterium]MBU4488179.1 discoidin domain-containing protein [Candidatus Omnitrophota bacterium]MCG2704613.1 discoidin domain-containing protein [Candidatus Omnitrophota bacterium]